MSVFIDDILGKFLPIVSKSRYKNAAEKHKDLYDKYIDMRLEHYYMRSMFEVCCEFISFMHPESKKNTLYGSPEYIAEESKKLGFTLEQGMTIIRAYLIDHERQINFPALPLGGVQSNDSVPDLASKNVMILSLSVSSLLAKIKDQFLGSRLRPN